MKESDHMLKIKNPIIPGMAPDPSIIRVENKYYIATSTFHWTPAIQLFESTDLKNWQLIDHVLKKEEISLKGTNTPAGIWAPHLSYDAHKKRYWIAYSHMLNMAGREFNADSYALWSESIHGPWSEPIYLTSIGFDPSIFHADDGKKYIAILEWESRPNYQAPGHIVIAEFNFEKQKIVGSWHRVTTGFTSRGAAEAPIIYKRNGYYYLMIAAGGTGYAHGVEIGRSKDIFGPYESHPSGEPIITSSPEHLFSLGDPDAGQFEMYNPNSNIQKSGHGSLVETPNGEWYVAHLMSRPLPGTTLNPLGRETGIQKVNWTADGWLQMADGTNFAKENIDGPQQEEATIKYSEDITEYFNEPHYDERFLSPYRFQNKTWVNHLGNTNYLRIYGGESLFSQMNPSILATRATSFTYSLETEVEIHPDHYSESAGAGLYYDANNWLYANLYWSEPLNAIALGLTQAKLGEKKIYQYVKVPISNGHVQIKFVYNFGEATVFYRMSADDEWLILLKNVDVNYLSDEGVNGEKGEIGGFTGLFNFIAVTDAHQHDGYGDFSFYKVTSL